MPDYAYVLVTKKLKDFFNHIQSAGVPGKVTQSYLEKIGFKSPNDRSIIPVLRHIGFLDPSSVPTEVWQAYRDRQRAASVLATAIRSSYADLFTTYPDANRKDTEALRNYFSAHTRVADRALSAIVATFRTLCEMAEFGEDGRKEPKHIESLAEGTTEVIRRISQPDVSSGITVNINVQITVPETDKADVYDKFFAALKRNLIDQADK